MADTLRLFFALWPDERTREALRAAIPPPGRGGRAIPAENLHATLAFLGAVDSARLDELTSIAADVRAEPFTLTFDHYEEWNRSLIALVPTTAPPALEQLVGPLTTQLARAGWPTESRPYRAHVTLIRESRRGSGRREGLVMVDVPPRVPAVEWWVRDFVLVRSRGGAADSQYEVLHRWPLASR